MDFAAHGFEPLMIVRRKSIFTLLFQLFDLRFDHGSVNSFGVMVSECVNVESLADRGDQMLLVELRITLHCVVLDAGGDLAQLGDGLMFEFFVVVFSHDLTPAEKAHGVQAVACLFCPLENGSRKLKPKSTAKHVP